MVPVRHNLSVIGARMPCAAWHDTSQPPIPSMPSPPAMRNPSNSETGTAEVVRLQKRKYSPSSTSENLATAKVIEISVRPIAEETNRDRQYLQLSWSGRPYEIHGFCILQRCVALHRSENVHTYQAWSAKPDPWCRWKVND